jgi:hypothetical protein
MRTKEEYNQIIEEWHNADITKLKPVDEATLLRIKMSLLRDDLKELEG